MDRRTAIADAAIDLIAASGLRALTHRRIDAVLELPTGSTSYYFRTKSDLLSAVIDRITSSSRDTFGRFSFGANSPDGAAGDAAELAGEDPVEVTVRYLRHLLVERQAQLRTRNSLLFDPSVDSDARASLEASLFSADRAAELLGDRALGDGYVALCGGLVIAALARGSDRVDMRAPIVTYLTGAGKL